MQGRESMLSQVEHVKLQNTQTDWKIVCPFHSLEYSKYVCLDNSCEKKIICQKCCDKIESESSHKLMTIQECFKGMQNYVEMPETTEQFQSHILQIIEGTSLLKKKDYYMIQAEQVKDQLREEHINSIRIQMDRFKAEIENQISLAKDHIVQSYESKLQEMFSNESLKSKSFKDRGCKIVLQSLKGNCKSQEINNNMIKLHQGKYEICFAKDSMFTIYSEIMAKMENMISQNLRQIKEHMEEFSSFFSNAQKKQSIINGIFVKKQQTVQSKLSVSMLKSENINKDLSFPVESDKPVTKDIQPLKCNTPKNFVIKQITNLDEKKLNSPRKRTDMSDNDILEQNIFISQEIRQKYPSFDLKNIRKVAQNNTTESPRHLHQSSLFSSFIHRDKQISLDDKSQGTDISYQKSEQSPRTQSKHEKNISQNYYIPNKLSYLSDSVDEKQNSPPQNILGYISQSPTNTSLQQKLSKIKFS